MWTSGSRLKTNVSQTAGTDSIIVSNCIYTLWVILEPDPSQKSLRTNLLQWQRELEMVGWADPIAMVL